MLHGKQCLVRQHNAGGTVRQLVLKHVASGIVLIVCPDGRIVEPGNDAEKARIRIGPVRHENGFLAHCRSDLVDELLPRCLIEERGIDEIQEPIVLGQHHRDP